MQKSGRYQNDRKTEFFYVSPFCQPSKPFLYISTIAYQDALQHSPKFYKKPKKRSFNKMAKYFTTLAIVAVALTFASLLSYTHATDALLVEGKVYCDTCRVGFETKLTEYLAGAKIVLECSNRETGELTFSESGVTDATGTYKIEVNGEHEEDICEVRTVKSPRKDCNEIATWDKARVAITKHNGAITPIRYANAIGFTKKVAVKGCIEALKELGIVQFF